MKSFLILLLFTVILAIFQISFIHLNFLFMLVFVFSILLSERKALFYSFFAGLIFDLLGGSVLGISSLGFLIVSGAILLYRRKLSFTNPIIVCLFSFIFYIFFQWITGKHFFWGEAIILVFTISFVRIVFSDFFDKNLNKIKI